MKRQVLGKFNYSLGFLDLQEDREEWAGELEKRRKEASGEIAPPKHGHH
jgi:hypothetical protein